MSITNREVQMEFKESRRLPLETVLNAVLWRTKAALAGNQLFPDEILGDFPVELVNAKLEELVQKGWISHKGALRESYITSEGFNYLKPLLEVEALNSLR